MWPTTKLTQLLNIHYPIIQAPMAGGATTPELIANVCNAGALGSLGAGYMKPETIQKTIKQIRELTDKPFAVNLFIPGQHHATSQQIESMRLIIEKISAKFIDHIDPVKPPYAESFAEQVTVVLEEKVPIFSFTFGIPEDQWLKKLKAAGIILIGTATNLAEGKQLQQKNIDAIVAQGVESGGHCGTFLGKPEEIALMGNFALIPQLADHSKVPIIAAGGIMDARGILAALTLGAAGVQMGTAFLTCLESGIPKKYKELLLSEQQPNTVLTRTFSGKLARGIKNKFITDMSQHADDILDYPIQNTLTRQMRAEAAKKNLTDYLSLWAGQAATMCQDISAAKLIEKLNHDVNSFLRMKE